MESSIYKSNETVDHLIVTLVKIYPLSLKHAFTRASEISGRSISYCQSRYYRKLRYEYTMFITKTDHVELINTRRLTPSAIQDLEKLEAKILNQ